MIELAHESLTWRTLPELLTLHDRSDREAPSSRSERLATVWPGTLRSS
ncbi:hypothetical protein ACFPJ1_13945 [Kribbella qitaiheensis]